MEFDGKQYATVIAHPHALPTGRRYDTYEWKGKPWQLAVIAEGFNHYDDIRAVDRMPWPMKLVRREGILYQYRVYARADGIWSISAGANVAWEGLCRLGRGLKARAIMTLHVWGMGYTDEGEELSWRNLRRKSPCKW